MISDLARLTYSGYLYLVELFRGGTKEPPIPPELMDVISKITAAQNESRKKLDEITTEAAALLRTLTEKEAEQIARWRNELGEFLKNQGVDGSAIDEFLNAPSMERLDELRQKYPRMQE